MLNLKSLLLAAGFLSLSLASPLNQSPKNQPTCGICIDFANDCGDMYGGCWDYCAEPKKSFPIPDCKGKTGQTKICEYKKNKCGELVGECHTDGEPIPKGNDDEGCP